MWVSLEPTPNSTSSRDPLRMSRFRLLLLDAGIVIELFAQGLWDKIVERCEIHLSRTVVEQEAKYFVREGKEDRIDLRPYIAGGQIIIFDEPPSQVKAFFDSFDPTYQKRLDDGEAESLAHLYYAEEEFLISSADKIVY